MRTLGMLFTCMALAGTLFEAAAPYRVQFTPVRVEVQNSPDGVTYSPVQR